VTSPALSVLDLVPVRSDQTTGDALGATRSLARTADELGYRRYWLAEHHNMPAVAATNPPVLIAMVAGATGRIRVGSGGVMLPNHAPLAIAEQYGTLAELHPGRIDLGLGRAPGTDQVTLRALRRDPQDSERFPQDVLELQGYLSGDTRIGGVHATPGRGTDVPLYILGSSMFGGSLAAALGLPHGFASHFAPDELERSVAYYRANFQPSAQLDAPYVVAGVNVFAADTTEEAEAHLLTSQRRRVGLFVDRNRRFTDEEADELLASRHGLHVQAMARCSAVGTPEQVADQLEAFTKQADADELMVVFGGPTLDARLHAAELTAGAWGLS
jgi:luciferase family oxidoreductase group 1